MVMFLPWAQTTMTTIFMTPHTTTRTCFWCQWCYARLLKWTMQKFKICPIPFGGASGLQRGGWGQSWAFLASGFKRKERKEKSKSLDEEKMHPRAPRQEGSNQMPTQWLQKVTTSVTLRYLKLDHVVASLHSSRILPCYYWSANSQDC